MTKVKLYFKINKHIQSLFNKINVYNIVIFMLKMVH
jgi:hypothetical protein